MLIDLANGALTGAWFDLGIETHTTDAVLHELEQESQISRVRPFVADGRLKVSLMYEGASFEALQTLTDTAREMGVSIPDSSAFLLAQRLDAVLLTGDGDLRREAEIRGVVVRGVLWVLDLLLWQNAIGFEMAIGGLRTMLEMGARLPQTECDQRFRTWSASRKIEPRSVP